MNDDAKPSPLSYSVLPEIKSERAVLIMNRSMVRMSCGCRGVTVLVAQVVCSLVQCGWSWVLSSSPTTPNPPFPEKKGGVSRCLTIPHAMSPAIPWPEHSRAQSSFSLGDKPRWYWNVRK